MKTGSSRMGHLLDFETDAGNGFGHLVGVVGHLVGVVDDLDAIFDQAVTDIGALVGLTLSAPSGTSAGLPLPA